MEPRYLIGGPAPSEQVAASQKAAPKKIKKDKITSGVIEGKYKGKTSAQWRDMITTTVGVTVAQVREFTLCASLADADGIWEFPALFTLTGALVPDATYVKIKSTGRWVWRIGKGATASWFKPSQARSGATRRLNDGAKGFRVGKVRRRAYVASGLSKQGNVYHFIAEVAHGAMEIVDTGTMASYEDWS